MNRRLSDSLLAGCQKARSSIHGPSLRATTVQIPRDTIRHRDQAGCSRLSLGDNALATGGCRFGALIPLALAPGLQALAFPWALGRWGPQARGVSGAAGQINGATP